MKTPFQRRIIRPGTPRGFRVRVGKQKHGKCRFSSPRAHTETGVPPLWSPELAVFSGMVTMRFRAFLKIHILTPIVFLMSFVYWKECCIWCHYQSMLWVSKMDSIGESYSEPLSHLHQSWQWLTQRIHGCGEISRKSWNVLILGVQQPI